MYINETVFSTRPDDARLAKELRCYDFLEKLGISYLRVDHEFADTIEQCHEVEKVLGCEICKNLLLTNRQMTEVYLLLKLSIFDLLDDVVHFFPPNLECP